jgi:LemA protein
MKKALIIGGIIAGVLLLILGLFCLRVAGCYNSIVKKDQAVSSSWAQVQNVYQRRADLVPNLVATVSGAANKVQIDPTKVPTAEQMQAFQHAQDGLGSALSRLLVVSENYPKLRATENFRDLQTQLEGTENRIAVERKNFNDKTQELNSYIKQVICPLIAARIGGVEPKPYFQATEGSDKVPTVKF